MITLVCGEDQIASRRYFSDLKNKVASSSNIVPLDLQFGDIMDIRLRLAASSTLFSQSFAFFGENLNKKLNLRQKVLAEELKAIAKNEAIQFYIWESLPARELKLAKIAGVKEFKPKKNIFALLDSFYPGNKRDFIKTFWEVSSNEDVGLVFYMLARHIRSLILVAHEKGSSRLPPWQYGKLLSASKKWQKDKLIACYEALHKIDIRVKTSSSPYDLPKSLDILALYFL